LLGWLTMLHDNLYNRPKTTEIKFYRAGNTEKYTVIISIKNLRKQA
jgi:hypothetical protein